MPKVILKGHSYVYPVSDLLTLFSGMASFSGDCEVISGDDSVKIYSEITEEKVSTWTDTGLKTSVDKVSLRLPVQREVKRQLYLILTQIYDRSFPWGSLTGIRPTHVAMEEKTAKNLHDVYYVRNDKAELAVRVASAEERILSKIPKDSYSVYIGIPYCPSRCSYCSFISYESAGRSDRLEAYATALLFEIQAFFRQTEISPTNLYIGGGTPTVFDDNLFSNLFKEVFRSIPSSLLREITVEAGRADTITEKKLQVLHDSGVNRICINPQTTKDLTLKRLGRNHSSDDFYKAYELIKKTGFTTINTDLIAGLPGETEEDFKQSLQDVLSLCPENITIHTLAKKRSSKLSCEFQAIAECSSDYIDGMLSYAHAKLLEDCYHPYYLYRQKNTIGGHENTGYSIQGHECSYNVAMMSDLRPVISFGAGSISKRILEGQKLERCPNQKNPEEYIRRVQEMSDRKISFFKECL